MTEISEIRAALAGPPLGARPVDTNGWDTVSAVTIGDMNAAIRNAGTSPDSFEAEVDGGGSVSGAFEPWSIAHDGDGVEINLSVPLRNVTVSYGGADKVLPMGTATVRVQLEYLPAGPRMMRNFLGVEEEVETHILVLKTRLDKKMLMADPDAQVARVVSIDGRAELGTRHFAALKNALDGWFNDNLAAFHHVFATVNIAKIIGEDTEGGFDWMVPSAVSYAFGHNSADPDGSVLAILCQTGGRGADNLVAQVQADMIPGGANAAICISKARLLRDMLIKGVPVAYEGLSEADLEFTKKDSGVRLRHDVQLKDVEDDGRIYQPVLQQLDFTLRDTDIKIESKTETEVTAGFYSIASMIGTYEFGLGQNKDGKDTIKFNVLSEDPRYQERQDPSATVWEWVSRGVALLGMILMGFMTGGAFWVVAGITAALVIGNVTREGIKLMEGNNGPPIDPLLAAAHTAVSWSTAARFQPTFAGLNGGLQIGGLLGGGAKLMGAADMISAHTEFQAPFADLMAARARQ